MRTIGATRPAIARLRHDLDLCVADDDTVFLVSDRAITSVTGKLAVAVASRLDGTRTPDGIVSELVEGYSAERVRHVLDQLVASGHAVIEHGPYDRGLAGDVGLYEMGGVESAIAGDRLAAATVAIHAIGDVDSADVARQLRASGVGTVARLADPAEAAPGVTLLVVLTEDYLRCELDSINRVSLTTATPWLLARPVGSVVWVGPFFRPNVTGCWSCLGHRISANRQSRVFLQRRLGTTNPVGMSGVRHRVGSAIGAGLVSLEALKSITGMPAAEPSVVTIDLLTGDSDRHYFTRRPQCPVCGDETMLAARAQEPVRFSSRSKVLTSESGHRATEPAAMVERFSRQVSPITGVVTSLRRIAMPGSLYVFTAGQNIARQPGDMPALRRGLRALSGGKGTTEIQARASAIGEAIERFSAVFQGDELRRRATLSELGDAAVHPNACMLFSERQYEQRELWNLGQPGFRTVFEPFVEEEVIDWSPVWSMTNQCTRWLPTQYLYYGYPLEGGRLFAYADSNGCASGTSLEDAALQGFCELVERDSVALWWYNRVRRPGIDLDSFRDAYIDRLREIYAHLGREVWALDLTADLGIPAVGAFSRTVDADRENILIAFGAHLDARVAVVRALTEMNQFLPAVLPSAGSGAAPARYPDEAFETWCRTAKLANQPYLVPEPTAVPRLATSWPTQATDDLAVDLERCHGLVNARGLELLVLDQTRPDIGLPVVKVIVPGLRHFWPRFAPGRLFDVPVELGWCRRKTEEQRLNPVPVFI
jgi:oxazoline/thiazoline synthase